MKKIFRIAMVIALAGATLLYTGCTKDYSKQIDDLNSEVSTLQSTVQAIQTQVSALEALKTQVAALQGDVTGLQAAIDKCNATIAAIQTNYATKDEVNAAVSSLAAEVKTALDELAQNIAVNAANIETLSAAFATAYTVLSTEILALNYGKIQSLSVIPFNGNVSSVVKYQIKGSHKGWTPGSTVTTKILESVPQLFVGIKVRPAYMAEAFTSENSYIEAAGEYYPANVFATDAESGVVYAVATLDEAFGKVEGEYFPFAFEFCDGYSEESTTVANWISSDYSFATTTAEEKDLEYAPYDKTTGKEIEDFDPIQVQWMDYATSERTFMENVSLGVKFGKKVLPIENAANVLGVETATITPTTEYTIEVPKGQKTITVDEENRTAKMAATKEEEAVEAIGDYATYYVWSYFTVDYEDYYVSGDSQKYEVVKSQAADVNIEAVSIAWNGKAKTDKLDFQNLKADGEFSTSSYDRTLYVDFVDENGDVDTKAVGKLKQDAKLADVTFNAGAFTYTDAVQEFVAYTVIGQHSQPTYYTIKLPVTVAAKPADKVIDLGTFTASGSTSDAVTVKLPGVVKALVAGDEAMFFATEKDYSYATFANYASDRDHFTKIVWSDAGEKFEKVPGHAYSNYDLTFAYDAKKDEDGSTLKIDAGLAIYGSTYKFIGETTVQSVKREFTFTVEINDFEAKLVTTPYVGENNVISVTGEYVAASKRYTLNDVNLDHYFELDKAITSEQGMTVVFKFDYPTMIDPATGEEYAQYPMSNYAKFINENNHSDINIVKGDKKPCLVDIPATTGKKLEAAHIDWNLYQGRTITGTAYVGVLSKMWGWTPVSAPIEFTIQAVDPITKFEGKTVAKTRSVGQETSFTTDECVSITSTAAAVAITKEGFDAYGIQYGSVDADGKFCTFESIKTLEGTVNGVAFTLYEGTDFDFVPTNAAYGFGKFVFKGNNANKNISVSLPIAIKYNYDNREKKTATATVTFTAN